MSPAASEMLSRPFVVSIGVPRCHLLDRQPPRSGSAAERTQLARMARACFEEISATSGLRLTSADERFDWRSVSAFEQRMLSCLDALMALGKPFHAVGGRGERSAGLDLVPAAADYLDDAATSDPGRAFAGAFVLGCLAGDATARVAVDMLRGADTYTLRPLSEALSLAANPSLDRELAEALTDPDARLVLAALEALRLRGPLPVATVSPLLDHPEPQVRASAARTLGRARQGEEAARVLARLLAAEQDPEVLLAAAEALLPHLGQLAVARSGVEQLRSLLARDQLASPLRVHAMQLLAVAGAAEDHALLAEVYGQRPGEALALGFHGHPALVPVLLDRLEPSDDDEPLRLEAAAGLTRILGLPANSGVGPQDRYQPGAAPATWASHWHARAPEVHGDLRLRFGVPWTGVLSAAELAADQVPMAVRRLCALELACLLGEAPLQPDDLAARQLDTIARQHASTESRIAAEVHQAGQWPGVR